MDGTVQSHVKILLKRVIRQRMPFGLKYHTGMMMVSEFELEHLWEDQPEDLPICEAILRPYWRFGFKITDAGCRFQAKFKFTGRCYCGIHIKKAMAKNRSRMGEGI